MSRFVNFYRTQIELLWKWRLGRRALIKRAIVSLVAALIAFNITAWLFPGQLQITELGGGLVAVLFIAALNLLVRPAILALVASRSVVALVILTLLFQAVVIWLLGPFVPSVHLCGRLHRRLDRLVRFRLHLDRDQPRLRAQRGRLVLRDAGANVGEPESGCRSLGRPGTGRHPARRPVA